MTASLLWIALLAPPTGAPACPPGATAQKTTTAAVETVACVGADGLREGPLLRRSGGQMVFRAHYAKGQRTGPVEGWYADGRPRLKGAYDAGRRVGTWSLWDEAGWHREGAMLGDVPDGPWTIFDAEGRKRAAGAYAKGARDGAWQWFGEGPGAPVIGGSYDHGRFLMCDGACTLLQPQLEIEEAVRGMEAEASACYRRQQRTEPTLAGTVELHWKVGPDGGVTEVKEAGGTLPKGATRACLVDAVGRLRVAPPATARPVEGKRVWAFRPKSGFKDEITTHGPCRAKALRPVINPTRRGLIRCVKGSRPWPPPRPGEVGLRWHIKADGAVSGVGVVPDDAAELATCLSSQIVGLRFEGVGACRVEYTLRWE